MAWLASAEAHPLDIGHLEYEDQACYFLNIASAGISGEVDRRVNSITRRRPWTFYLASVRSFLSYQPPSVTVRLDGEVYYNGQVWVVVVANGGYFGRGMHIAPDAKIDDGLFEVLVIKGSSRFTVLRAFNTVYSGQHLLREDVMLKRAQVVEIETQNDPLPLDLDGEHTQGRRLHFRVLPAALKILIGKGS